MAGLKQLRWRSIRVDSMSGLHERWVAGFVFILFRDMWARDALLSGLRVATILQPLLVPQFPGTNLYTRALDKHTTEG
jgi:hypothetical protein